jgi:hypothetical protein
MLATMDVVLLCYGVGRAMLWGLGRPVEQAAWPIRRG